MIYIDLPADLNMEDDEGRNVARLSGAIIESEIAPGRVLVAGTPHAWTWAVIETVEDGLVFFHPISGTEAAQRALLVAPLPRPA